MKSTILIILICFSFLSNATTTYSGAIKTSKTNSDLINVEYTFIIDYEDSTFNANSFSSNISCDVTGNSVTLDNILFFSEEKIYANCARTSFKRKVLYFTSVDLTDAKYSSINSCCNLKIDATCGQRSSIITNLSSQNTNFYIYTEIENCNTSSNISPIFTPAANINCLNNQYSLIAGAIDSINNDSIAYEIVPPLSDQNSPIGFKGSYYSDQPLLPFYPGGNSYPIKYPLANPAIGFDFNTQTGECIYTPTQEQDAGPITIKAEEWRKNLNGIYHKISTSHVEFFIATQTCSDNNPPTITGPVDTTIIAGSTICFDIISDDRTFVPPPPATAPQPDSVKLWWDQAIPAATFTITNPTDRLPIGEFCWTTDQDDIKRSPHVFTVKARDNACPFNAETTKSFRITVVQSGSIHKFDHTLNFYPNPANSTITLTGRYKNISIYNSVGQLVISFNHSSRLDISSLKSGHYIIKADDNNKIFTGNFIKM